MPTAKGNAYGHVVPRLADGTASGGVWVAVAAPAWEAGTVPDRYRTFVGNRLSDDIQNPAVVDIENRPHSRACTVRQSQVLSGSRARRPYRDLTVSADPVRQGCLAKAPSGVAARALLAATEHDGRR